MKEKLINYGFVLHKIGWLEFKKNDWTFQYSEDGNNGYMWVYPPIGSDEDGICLRELTYEKIVQLIDFISEYR